MASLEVILKDMRSIQVFLQSDSSPGHEERKQQQASRFATAMRCLNIDSEAVLKVNDVIIAGPWTEEQKTLFRDSLLASADREFGDDGNTQVMKSLHNYMSDKEANSLKDETTVLGFVNTLLACNYIQVLLFLSSLNYKLSSI